MWLDGALHFCTGPVEQKARNIEGDPRCVLTTGSDRVPLRARPGGRGKRGPGDGRFTATTSGCPLGSKLDRPYDVEDGAFRERASEIAGADFDGRSVAHVFMVSPSKVLAFGKGGPFSQTRYRFDPPVPWRERTVDVDGLTVHYLEQGEALPSSCFTAGSPSQPCPGPTPCPCSPVATGSWPPTPAGTAAPTTQPLFWRTTRTLVDRHSRAR